MTGQTWNSEIREFTDKKTGRRIKQLTQTGNNIHLYFTENSFDCHKNEIIFMSDLRRNGRLNRRAAFLPSSLLDKFGGGASTGSMWGFKPLKTLCASSSEGEKPPGMS